MARRLGIAILFLLILVGAGIAFAQTPPMDDTYNWCSDPAYWGDGRCDHPDDETLQTWYWNVGWYIPRCLQESGFDMNNSICRELLPDICEGAGEYFVVMLEGSIYTGAYDLSVAGDDFDASTFSILCEQGYAIHGNQNSNTLIGSGGNDLIVGYGGADHIEGGAGDDDLYGRGGSDTLYGGEGSDLIDGGDGHDDLYGDGGDDLIRGDGGNDMLSGGSGNDILRGGDNNDTLYGDDGDDELYGGAGDDSLDGGAAYDVGSGNAGTDVCTAMESVTSCGR